MQSTFCFSQKKRTVRNGSHIDSGGDLLSRAVSSQVPSALKGLTSVFGMGTGGTLSPLSPEFSRILLSRTLKTAHPDFSSCLRPVNQFSLWSHLILLNFLDQVLDRLVSASFYVTAFTPLTYLLVVFQGSYFFRMGYLFLRWASRLDAFSVYPLRISLPSCALGRTTVAPVMRPLRSSRTRSSSSHVSFAHDG